MNINTQLIKKYQYDLKELKKIVNTFFLGEVDEIYFGVNKAGENIILIKWWCYRFKIKPESYSCEGKYDAFAEVKKTGKLKKDLKRLRKTLEKKEDEESYCPPD